MNAVGTLHGLERKNPPATMTPNQAMQRTAGRAARAYLVLVVIVLANAPCNAGKPIVRNGSTLEKAIRLNQRGTKAIEEEMSWMMKLHHYTPLLSTRDAFAEAVRQIKVDKKKEG